MRRITAVLIASFLMLFGLTGCSLTEQDLVEVTHNTEVPPQMVFFGDSIPDGFGLDGFSINDNSACKSYPNLLEEKYRNELSEEKCDTKMTNFAVSGYTSQNLLEQIQKGKCDDALRDADAIVISIGGNDLLHFLYSAVSDSGVKYENGKIDLSEIDLVKAVKNITTFSNMADSALEKFEVNLNEITDTLSDKSDGIIYIQTLYNPFEPYCDIPVFGEFITEKCQALNDIIVNNSKDKYCVIDAAAAFSGRAGELTRINEVDIHPNEKGHEVIAELVDKAFRETGFTYICQEYTEPHLTSLAYGLIIGGVGFTLLIVLLIIPLLFRKHLK